MFLTLLFFASHILLNLWAVSTVDEAAHQAAVAVALADDDVDRRAAEARAIARARSQLGSFGDRVEFRFEHDASDASVVELGAYSQLTQPA